jgi:arylesterase/paraoxonase
MGRLFRRLGVIAVVLLIVVGGLLYRTLNAAGYFTTVTSSFAGTCTPITGVVGAEDMELDRTTGELFISSQNRRPFPLPPGQHLVQGDILLAHLDQPEVPPQSLTAVMSWTLHPHGLSLYRDGNGKRTLAVVNHVEPETSEIMLFDVVERAGATPQLSLRRRVKDPLIHDANDVTLVGHEAFYVTNDHGSRSAMGRMLEDYLLIPRADVVYYDGNAARVVASSLNYANGINRSADLATVYVAETTGRTLDIFHRDTTSGALTPVRSLFLGAGPDNIDVDAEGNLWIAAHPKMLDFLAHAQDAKKHSPSMVLRVDPTAEDGAMRTIYTNTGEEMSGSSIAVSNGKRLAIGAVFEPKYLNCDQAGRISTSTRSGAPLVEPPKTSRSTRLAGTPLLSR